MKLKLEWSEGGQLLLAEAECDELIDPALHHVLATVCLAVGGEEFFVDDDEPAPLGLDEPRMVAVDPLPDTPDHPKVYEGACMIPGSDGRDGLYCLLPEGHAGGCQFQTIEAEHTARCNKPSPHRQVGSWGGFCYLPHRHEGECRYTTVEML